jgi:hypothetical protein
MTTVIDDAFEPLYGSMCWGVAWDCQTGVRLNFGRPHLIVREPVAREPDPEESDSMNCSRMYRGVWVVGDWSLRIEDAYWKLTLRDIPAVTGSSPWQRIEMGLARLDGQELTSVVVNPNSAATRLTFDLGGVLDVRRLGRGDDGDLWTLHTPNDRRLSVRGDGCYHFGRGTSRHRTWKPIGRGPNKGIEQNARR